MSPMKDWPPTHCARCGGDIVDAPAGDVRRYPRCARCGIQHVNHDLSPDKFPLTLKLLSGKTGEILWWRTITIEAARQVAQITIPSYRDTEHYPVRAEVTYADGTTEIQGMT